MSTTSRTLTTPLSSEQAPPLTDTAEAPTALLELQLDGSAADVELSDDPCLVGIPAAVIAQVGCYDTDSAGGCG